MQALSQIVYIAMVDVEPAWEDELNRWYAEEHIPNLLRVPGYYSARRYAVIEGQPKYVGLYEIASLDAYKGPAHAQAVDTPWTARVRPHFSSRFGFYEQITPEQGFQHGAAWQDDGTEHEGGLLINLMDVPAAEEQDFNDWYDQEHLPALAAVPGDIACRRFRAIEGSPTYMAVYHLTDPAVQASAAWAKAVDTPWTHRMRGLFQNRARMVCRPLVVPVAGG